MTAAFFTTLVSAKDPYSAKSYILMDADTGKVLLSKGIHDRSLIASTTKIMTGLLVLEHCDLERIISVPKEAVGVEGSSMYLKLGEELTIRELLYGLMLHSGNDAAVALAIATAGSVESFVCLMNEKAKSLGLCNTHFDNPNGLDSTQHYSTAYDLALLTKAALENGNFRDVVGSKTVTIGNRSFRNHNRLLWMGEGILGVKTGYTKAAGRILVSACRRNGRTLIAVTINDGNDWQDHLALYDHGFSLYHTQVLISEGQELCEIPLLDGSKVKLYAEESLEYAITEGETPIFYLGYPHTALVDEGAVVIHVYLGDLRIKTMHPKWGYAEYGKNTETHSLSGTVLPKNGGRMDP